MTVAGDAHARHDTALAGSRAMNWAGSLEHGALNPGRGRAAQPARGRGPLPRGRMISAAT